MNGISPDVAQGLRWRGIAQARTPHVAPYKELRLLQEQGLSYGTGISAHDSARGISKGSAGSSSGSEARGGTHHNHFAFFYDKSDAMKHLDSQEGRKFFVDLLNRTTINAS